jgi:hypothetical protein
VPLHYGLGVSASYLRRRDETIHEFRWVLEHGLPTSDEVHGARSWLQSVGALPRTPAVATANVTEEPSDEAPKPAAASISGRATLEERPGEMAVAMQRMQLFLHSYPNRVTYLRIRTDEDGRFRFTGLAPGTYKLTDRIAGPARWRLRVELKPGQELRLDLDSANSIRVRDDFPEPTPASKSQPS